MDVSAARPIENSGGRLIRRNDVKDREEAHAQGNWARPGTDYSRCPGPPSGRWRGAYAACTRQVPRTAKGPCVLRCKPCRARHSLRLYS
jgi:hypothetical protein